jgi:hypothetical protein
MQMENPNVISTIVDKEKDIRFDIVAYRKLTRAEMIQAVSEFYNQKKMPKKLKPGSTIKIITIIGYDT